VFERIRTEMGIWQVLVDRLEGRLNRLRLKERWVIPVIVRCRPLLKPVKGLRRLLLLLRCLLPGLDGSALWERLWRLA